MQLKMKEGMIGEEESFTNETRILSKQIVEGARKQIKE